MLGSVCAGCKRSGNQDQAVLQAALEHTERMQHTDVHAIRESEHNCTLLDAWGSWGGQWRSAEVPQSTTIKNRLLSIAYK